MRLVVSIAFAAHLGLTAFSASAEAPALHPGLNAGFFDLVPTKSDLQVRVQSRLALDLEATLGIGQHFLVAAGYLVTPGSFGWPDDRLLSVRLNYLLLTVICRLTWAWGLASCGKSAISPSTTERRTPDRELRWSSKRD